MFCSKTTVLAAPRLTVTRALAVFLFRVERNKGKSESVFSNACESNAMPEWGLENYIQGFQGTYALVVTA